MAKIFRPMRQRRYDTYIAHHFRPFEAYEFSAIRYSEAPYLKVMIKERDKMWKSFSKMAELEHLTKKETDKQWVSTIKNNYEIHDWLTVKDIFMFGKPAYKASPFKMLKSYRQDAIDRGEYVKPKKKHGKYFVEGVYKHLYKGDIEGQRRRYKESIKRLTGTDLEKYREQRRKQRQRAKERKRRFG